MRQVAALLVSVSLAACGGGGSTTSSSAQTGLDCYASVAGLLSVVELPDGLKETSEGASPVLGLLDNGDASYPGFVGRAQRNFINPGLHAPADLSQNPAGLFELAEATMDFGNPQNAEKWMAGQKSIYIDNSNPQTRSGVTAVLPTKQIGDDTFAYQLARDANGTMFTDIQSRTGSVIEAISIDTGPQYPAASQVVSLVEKLAANEVAICARAG